MWFRLLPAAVQQIHLSGKMSCVQHSVEILCNLHFDKNNLTRCLCSSNQQCGKIRFCCWNTVEIAQYVQYVRIEQNLAECYEIHAFRLKLLMVTLCLLIGKLCHSLQILVSKVKYPLLMDSFVYAASRRMLVILWL